MGTDPQATALAVVDMAYHGGFAEIEELFAPRLRAAVSVEMLRSAWENETGANGPVTSIGDPTSEPVDGAVVRVSVPVACAQGEFIVAMSIDRSGSLQGLRFTRATPPWEPPAYAVPQRFDEQDVTIGSGPLAVPGTLSLPHGEGSRPGVVLLGGGGPQDRDESSGPNKPLKDLAWGLANRGVVVVRFDKVNHHHESLVADMADFTMVEEYVPHAIAAVRLLQKQSGVDSSQVFLLGHSMGGKVAPRVAAAEPSIAGLVIAAGDAQPMHHAAVRVVGHLASLNPGPAAQATVETITRQAALVDSPELSPSTPATSLPFGFRAPYWMDMRDYDPVAAAADLETPMLIVQGGRDYQVTVDDDLSRWKAGLRHRPDVTMRVYDADDHLFFPGSGPSTPAGYEAPQHFDPAVIADIARWLKRDRQDE